MRFLGTGAAELYPNPYCDCEVCERARRAKEIRLRSAFLLNEHNMVDFGVDVLAASALYDIPLYAIENVFITHTHPDHFCLDNIGAATMAGKRSGHWPIRFYLSAPAKAWLEQYLAAVRPLYGGASEVDALLQMGRVEFCAVEPYRWFEAGGLRVFALETNHIVNGKEPALNYLFEMPDGTRLLYACDTGLYGEKALGALAGARIGIVVTEGTFGSKSLPRESAHLCGQNCCEQLRALERAGALAEGARAYITHINQENEWDTAQYQAYMDKNAPIPVTIARDGMEIGQAAMKENKYDDAAFFAKYAGMHRSIYGLAGAAEWAALRAMLPDTAGKSVLDLGCGYGWHCRYFAESGASRVLGIDLSERMLAEARSRANPPAIEYRRAAMEELDFPAGSFDLVFSSLAFHYVRDFAPLVANIARWLKRGGALVCSMEHPVFTSSGPQDWDYAPDGTIRHFPVDRYFEEGEREAIFLGERVIKYHRTLTTIVGALFASGLRLTGLVEPQPPEDMLDLPGMRDEMRRPMMLLLSAEKA